MIQLKVVLKIIIFVYANEFREKKTMTESNLKNHIIWKYHWRQKLLCALIANYLTIYCD